MAIVKKLGGSLAWAAVTGLPTTGDDTLVGSPGDDLVNLLDGHDI